MLNTKLKNIRNKKWWINLVLVTIGVFLVAVGSAINFCANLGNDPVSVFFAGVSVKFKISLGMAVFLMNTIAFLVSLIFFRKNIGIGTIMYIFLTGKIVNIIVPIYNSVFNNPNLITRSISALIGCFVMIFGASLMVVSNTGADVWTATAMNIADSINKNFKKVKVVMDCVMCVVGFIFGGKVGIVTIATALFGAPTLKLMVKNIEKYLNYYKER